MPRNRPNPILLAVAFFADIFKAGISLAITAVFFVGATGAPIAGTVAGAGVGCVVGGAIGGIIGFFAGFGVGTFGGAAAGCAIGGGAGAAAGTAVGGVVSTAMAPMGMIVGYVVTVCLNFCIGMGGIVMFLILTGAVRLKTFLLFIMPAFIISNIPFVGSLAPSWTAIVWKVTSQQKPVNDNQEAPPEAANDNAESNQMAEDSSPSPASMNDDIRTPQPAPRENYA